jgi:hypothetical protein
MKLNIWPPQGAQDAGGSSNIAQKLSRKCLRIKDTRREEGGRETGKQGRKEQRKEREGQEKRENGKKEQQTAIHLKD